MKKSLTIIGILCLGLSSVLAQTVQVSGTVTGADDGQPLPGVSVVVKGTTQGTVTNVNGKYSFDVPASATLQFSFVGMASQEIAVGNRQVIHVAMHVAAQEIGEVVVTALGITRIENSIGFAISNVGSDKIVQKSEPDALRALEGKVPGVAISATSGAAGSSTRITIRGNSSFYGNNQPLFVVDGVPYSNETPGSGSGQLTGSGGAYGNAFNTLDPNDIETMQVLKGTAAAALYGSRAANGVILVTTKSGSKTRRPSQKGTEITVQSSWSWESVSSLPDYQNTYGAGTYFAANSASNGSWGGRLDAGDSITVWGQYGDAYPSLFPSGKVPYQAYPNNVKDMFRTGFLQEYSVNAASQSDRGALNVTASYTDQDSYIPNTEFSRIGVSVGGSNRLDNRFKIGGNMSFSRTDQLGSTFGNQQFEGQSSSFGRTLFLARNWDPSLPYTTPDGKSVSWVGDQTDHPLWAAEHNTVNTRMTRILSRVNMGYEIFPWLSVDYQLGMSNLFLDRKSLIDIGSRAAGGLGKVDVYDYQNHEIESNFLITFNKMLTGDISLQAVLGNNVNQRRKYDTSTGGTEFLAPNVYTATNAKNPYAGSSSSERRLYAFFGDVSLGYRNFAFLNLTGRNDFSSTLPKSNNSYFYPAVSASVLLTEAVPGIKSQILSTLRIRGSWAKVGNDASPYYVDGTYNIGNSVGNSFAGQPMMSIPSISYDPNLKPEFTKEFEVGGNLGIWKDRIMVDLAWYNRKSTDQIAPLLLPASSGKTDFYTNFGEVQNRGLEVMVDAAILKVDDDGFNWNLTWVFSKNESEVVSLYGDSSEPLTMYTGCSNCPAPMLEKGMPYGYLRGTKVYRDDEGNLLVNPASGLMTNDVEEGYIGNPYPDYQTSVTSALTYKGISLGFIIDFQKGGDYYMSPFNNILGRGVTKFNEDREGGFIIPGYLYDPSDPSKPLLDANGDKIKNTIPLAAMDLWFTDGFGVNAADEFSMFDCTTVRLREVSLGYAIPKNLLQKLPFGAIDITFTARNLWFYAPNIPKHINLDPVANTFGADSNIRGLIYDVAPSSKRYGINLRFTF
ncbi:MAG: SusC/RagA family TonB-linked outer membrane protein [Bacteroidales bacterium]|jgi:TonB-linked SusC/RagA family outer membrane protein|nr:SusC/RagA family TonB-linked outer membrane protein [Bacteroidales bacterium]